MKSPQCPRHAREIAILERSYRHLSRSQIKARIRDHQTLKCPECPSNNWTIPPGTPRDPGETP